MFLSIFRCSGRVLIGPRRRMYQPICRQAIYQVSSLRPHSSLRSRRRFITSWSAEFVDEKWPKLVAKKVCACFFAGLVESFFPPYLHTCLFSPRPDALCNGLSYATEVFDGGESNERLTIWSFLLEHAKTASETPRCLRFSIVFNSFPCEFANGQTFIRFLLLF